MSISPTMVKFAIAGAAGIGLGYGASKVFDGAADDKREAFHLKQEAAREQLSRPGLTPEVREGLQRLVDDEAPQSSATITGMVGAGVAAGAPIAAGAALPLAGLVYLLSLGNATGMGTSLQNFAVGGAILGAGIIAGAGIHALTD